jgi:kynureninase
MDDLLKWRGEFPILEKTVYLISNSLGAMPRAVYDKMHEYAEMWATRGVRAWSEGWWELPIAVGDELAYIIGAGSGEVSTHQNVSIAEAIILSCFDFRGTRNKIVLMDMEFPSIVYLYQAQCKNGARIEMVKSHDGISIPLESLLAAIDEQTLLVPVSHVLFRSAYIQDAKAIIEKAHAVGAHVVLDVYQSAGTVPIDVGALDVDFAVGGVLKWLCGGPGVAFLYVRPDLVTQLEPKMTGWMAHQHPFNFEVGAIKYRDDAYRFLNGTPHIPSLYAAQAGLKILREVGVEKIRAKSVRQTSRLIQLADEHGFKVTAPRNDAQRAGTVAINAPHAYEVSQELLRREFLVDYRPQAGIRISPHFYNKDEELDLVIQEIKKILETKAYEHHMGSKTVVT